MNGCEFETGLRRLLRDEDMAVLEYTSVGVPSFRIARGVILATPAQYRDAVERITTIAVVVDGWVTISPLYDGRWKCEVQISREATDAEVIAAVLQGRREDPDAVAARAGI